MYLCVYYCLYGMYFVILKLFVLTEKKRKYFVLIFFPKDFNLF